MRVILDTNFFLIPVKFKVDVFAELDRIIEGKYEVVTLEPVVRELRGLAKEKGKDGMAARVGLKLLEEKVRVVKFNEKDADVAILKFAKKGDVVATLDAVLEKRLLGLGRKVIYLRAKKYLVLNRCFHG